jgi:hypothetical protein
MTRSLSGRSWAYVMAMVLVCGTVMARDIYVSPTGKPDGDGTKDKPLDVFTALGDGSPAKGGDTIFLMGGMYEGRMNGTKRVPFSLAVSGESAEKPVKITPVPGAAAHLNGTGDLKSSYAEYIGLDIGDLKWDASQKTQQDDTALNATGGVGAKMINCNIFGGSMGTGGWSTARELMFYGCLIHDFGTMDLDAAGRGHGHAFYTQNEPGTGTKVIERNIAYRGCGWNLHIYTQGGQITGFDVIENIMYIAGAQKPGQTMDNYLVYGYVPSDQIRLLRNVGYQPTDVEAWRPNMRFSYLKAVQNKTGEIRDNYMMGAFYGVSLGDSQKCTFTGNTVWSTGILVEVNSAPTGSSLGKRDFKPDPKNYVIENNTYIANGKPKPFYYGDSEKVDETELVTFADWQKLGFDKDSKVIEGKNGRPSGTKIFVFDNKYEKGRGNIGIFNWDGLDKVSVDLSPVLAKGQSYKIYNCLDIRQTLALAKPVLTGTYAGAAVEFPMKKDRISPNFDAFLVVPVNEPAK